MTNMSRLAVLLLSIGLLLTVIDGFAESWSVSHVIAVVLLAVTVALLLLAPRGRPAS